jgi:hypothetical protein
MESAWSEVRIISIARQPADHALDCKDPLTRTRIGLQRIKDIEEPADERSLPKTIVDAMDRVLRERIVPLTKLITGGIVIFTLMLAVAVSLEWLLFHHRIITDTTSGALYRGRAINNRMDRPKIPALVHSSPSEAPIARQSLVLRARTVKRMELSPGQLARLHTILDRTGAEVDDEFASRLGSKFPSPPVTKTELLAQQALDVLTDNQKRMMLEVIERPE